MNASEGTVGPRGGTRRLPDEQQPPPSPCLNRQHRPAAHMVYQPGRYEHVCPGCGERLTFTVPGWLV